MRALLKKKSGSLILFDYLDDEIEQGFLNQIMVNNGAENIHQLSLVINDNLNQAIKE